VQSVRVHLRVHALDEERRLHAPRREQVEQPREHFDDGEVLPFGHVRRPHAELELGGLAEVVERHRHGWLGHEVMIGQARAG
jgi:hypothetical protein